MNPIRKCRSNLLLTSAAAALILAFGSASPVMAQSSVRSTILETYVGAWCGFCPDGAVVRDEVVAAHQGRAIPVDIHSSDGMLSSDGSVITAFYGPAYPQATIDRQGPPVSRSTWVADVDSRLQTAASADVSVSAVYDPDTNQITGTVSTTFTDGLTGDLRFGVMVVEDNVVGTGSGYNQVNYLNSTPGHPYYQAGDPIVGYVHRYVLRATPLGPWGASGSLPAAVAFGESYEQDFVYSVPGLFDVSQLRVVGFVAEYGPNTSDRSFVNAATAPVLIENLFASGFEVGSTSEWSTTVTP